MPFSIFFFWGGGSIKAGGRVRYFLRGGDFVLRTRGMTVPRSVRCKTPTRRLRSTLIAVSGIGRTGN